ncbi:aminoglycoside phosphotransferase family protein [Geodermatophilus sp. SYSU D00815]
MSDGVVVPPRLRTAMTAIHGERGAAWCDRLPALVRDRARAWGLTLGAPFAAEYHWVAPGRRGPDDVVLKLGIRNADRDLEREAGVLAAWGGSGAVRLLDADLDGAGALALLLERVRPGTDLEGVPDDEAFPLLGAVARALHGGGTSRPAVAVEPADLADLAAGHPLLPAGLTAAAARLRDELLATAGDPVLCHGDLHHGNVLRGPGGAVAIDPRGVWAEPALDVAVAMLNPLGTLPPGRAALAALLERRLRLVCPAMDVDVDRARAWTAVYAVTSALWSAEDGLGVEEESLAVAGVLL